MNTFLGTVLCLLLETTNKKIFVKKIFKKFQLKNTNSSVWTRPKSLLASRVNTEFIMLADANEQALKPNLCPGLKICKIRNYHF